MKSVGRQVRWQVRDRLEIRVWGQVGIPLWYRARDRLKYLLWNQVADLVKEELAE